MGVMYVCVSHSILPYPYLFIFFVVHHFEIHPSILSDFFLLSIFSLFISPVLSLVGGGFKDIFIMPVSGKALEENSRFCKCWLSLWFICITLLLLMLFLFFFCVFIYLFVRISFVCLSKHVIVLSIVWYHAISIVNIFALIVFIVGCFGLPWLWVVNCIYLHDKVNDPNNGDTQIWYYYSLIGSIVVGLLLVRH